jgi:hypothetical protein
MTNAKELAEAIAWLSDGELDNLAEILINNHPTMANRLEIRIAAWKERVIPKPAPAPAPKKTNILSDWWR